MNDPLTAHSDKSPVRSSPAEGSRQGRVEVRGIEKSYGPLTVLRETNLVVEPGEFFTLLGPSGSGKTTLLNIIAGFTEQSAGIVLIDDARVDHLPVHKRNIGMVFQNYSLIPHMTVSQNVAFPLTMR
jgi:putative spermidine/putrescine transport system ATP-binding protein